jgi:hypothetical protein
METGDRLPPERHPEGAGALRTVWHSKPGLILVCTLVGTGTFGVDVVFTGCAAISLLYAVIVLCSLRAGSRQLTRLVTSVCSLLTIGVFFQALPGSMGWMDLVNRTLVLGTLWGIALGALPPPNGTVSTPEPMGSGGEHTPSAGRSLGGFLPICASCKNVRDDHGAWHQIEAYIRAHSEAQFTHSICPDCIRRLYPEHG